MSECTIVFFHHLADAVRRSSPMSNDQQSSRQSALERFTKVADQSVSILQTKILPERCSFRLVDTGRCCSLGAVAAADCIDWLRHRSPACGSRRQSSIAVMHARACGGIGRLCSVKAAVVIRRRSAFVVGWRDVRRPVLDGDEFSLTCDTRCRRTSCRASESYTCWNRDRQQTSMKRASVVRVFRHPRHERPALDE